MEVIRIEEQERLFESSDIGLRYLNFLYFVERHDFITSSQLARMRGTTERASRYILNKLFDAGYLDKTKIKSQQTRTYPYQYFITFKARDLICKHNSNANRSKLIVRRNDYNKQISHLLLRHNLGVNDFFSRVISQSEKHHLPGIELWATSRECCLPVPIVDDHIKPDGYAILKTNSGYVHFVLEYDRATETLARGLNDKFTKYLKYAETEMYIHHFNFESEGIYFDVMPLVLFLTTKNRRTNNMKDYLEMIAEKDSLSEILRYNYFFFAWETQDSMSDVLGNIWLRAGYDDNKYSILDK